MNEELKLAFEIVKGPHQLEGPLIKGVAAATLIKDVGPVVIMAPDMEKLHKAFEKIANTKIIEEYTIFAIGQYKKREAIEKKVEKIIFPNSTVYWWYLPGANNCIMEFDNCDFNGNEHKLLGVAVKETERECKQLLSRVLGFSMKEINQIEINPTPPIPF